MHKPHPSEEELIKFLLGSKEVKDFQNFVRTALQEIEPQEKEGIKVQLTKKDQKIKQLLQKSLSTYLDQDIRTRALEFLEGPTEFALFGADNGEREKLMEKVRQCLDINRKCILKDFNNLLPLRGKIVYRLVGLLYRKISNSRVVRAPLLVGPPGTGKSVAVEALVRALNKNGIHTKLIRRTVASREEAVKDLEMDLLGTEAHYSNAFPGALSRTVARKDVNLVVVFLDELEKGMPHIYPLLLNLLDPAQPLEDHFLQGVFAGYPHDLRFKTFFVAAVNNPEPIFDIPELRDRFEAPLIFEPYSREEIIELVLKLYPNEFGRNFRRMPKEKVRKIAQELVKYSLSFREILSLVEDRLLENKLSGYRAPLPSAKTSRRHPIGFHVT